MHDDRTLVEARLKRVLGERIRPAVYPESVPLAVAVWNAPGEPVPVAEGLAAVPEPIAAGDQWGVPWGTSWFTVTVTGTVPAAWSGRTVEALLDLGFDAEARPPAGYHALGDPRIGHVLRLLHRRPARPWTVATLAAEAGMSRAAFARRFTALVGRPPLGYLTDWRMALAADLLRESAATVAEVARQVGYTDPFTFSAAFKRVRGTAPSALRRDRADIPSAVR